MLNRWCRNSGAVWQGEQRLIPTFPSTGREAIPKLNNKSTSFEIPPSPSCSRDNHCNVAPNVPRGCSPFSNRLIQEKILLKKDQIGYRTTYSISIPHLSDRKHEENHRQAIKEGIFSLRFRSYRLRS